MRQWKSACSRAKRTNPIEEAFRLKAELDRSTTGTQAEVAAKLQISRSRLNQYLRLLKLPDIVLRRLQEIGNEPHCTRITERTLRAIVAIDDPKEQTRRLAQLGVGEISHQDASHTQRHGG